MSQVIAVAGGTGGLGRALVEAITAVGKFSVVVLAREADGEKERKIAARILPVNYANVDDLIKSLEDNNVHTIISTINNQPSVDPELNLIAAADRAKCTKRYIPSIWGAKYTREYAEGNVLAKPKIILTDALEKTNLEHTTWYTGYFADYYISPPLKSYINTLTIMVDVANNAAGIPGSGDVPVAFIYTLDLAKFVAASLALPKWRRETYLVGDKMTLNRLVELAESVKGVTFQVAYDSVDSLEAGKITELPGHLGSYQFFPKEQLQALLAAFGLMFERGIFDVKAGHTVTQDFPDIKLRSMKELLDEAWKPKA
ncbi:hypothetical protein F5883DRAFT_509355 [Diaporthe sp. PMI_573]|nr:hypothetical protein F5883DRAFT_509355 [Diaporthaceae sp. PMI_573]